MQLDKNFEPLTLKEMEKLEPLLFKDGATKGYYQTINIGSLKPRKSEVTRLVSQGVRPAEAILADRWQQYFNVQLVGFNQDKHKMIGVNPPDLAETSDLPTKQWRTLDIMYAIEPKADIRQFLRSFNKSEKAWQRSKDNIIKHIEKSDIVPMYMGNFDTETATKIKNFVLSLPKEKQAKVVFIWEDGT